MADPPWSFLGRIEFQELCLSTHRPPKAEARPLPAQLGMLWSGVSSEFRSHIDLGWGQGRRVMRRPRSVHGSVVPHCLQLLAGFRQPRPAVDAESREDRLAHIGDTCRREDVSECIWSVARGDGGCLAPADVCMYACISACIVARQFHVHPSFYATFLSKWLSMSARLCCLLVFLCFACVCLSLSFCHACAWHDTGIVAYPCHVCAFVLSIHRHLCVQQSQLFSSRIACV